MISMRHIGFAAASIALASILFLGQVDAVRAEYPERQITMIVPVGAGGGTDTHARALAQEMQAVLGQPINVVNRPGGGGYVGAKSVVDARADGYTVMVQSYGTFLLNALRKPQVVDPLTDFKIVGLVGELYTGLVVRKDDTRFKSVEDFVGFAKANPGMTYSFSGTGSWHHAAASSFASSSGFEARPVAFKGGADARAAVLGGQVDFSFMGVQQLAGFEDQLVMLAVNGDERYPLTPDTPTFKEKDIGYTLVTSPMVVAVHKDVDEAIVERLQQAVETAAKSDGYRTALKNELAVPRFLARQEARRYLESLAAAWKPIAQAGQ